MADFAISQIGGPPGASVAPEQPVVDRSREVGLEFLGTAIRGLGEAAVGVSQVRAEREEKEAIAAKEAAKSQVMNEFSSAQLQLVDAVETGQMSSQEARMRMRANLSKYSSNNLVLTSDLAKAHTAVVKTTGLGDVVTEGTQEEQNQRLMETAALKEGWFDPNANAAEREQGVAAYGRWLDAQRIMKDEQDRMQMARAQVGLMADKTQLQSARLSLQQTQNKVAAQRAIGMATEAYTPKFANDMEQIRRAQEAGIMTREQAIMAANQKMLEVQQFVTTNFSQAGAEALNNQLAGVKMLHENYGKYLSGEVKEDTLKRDNNIAVGLQTQMILGDPILAKAAAANGVFRNSDMVTNREVNVRVARLLQVNTDAETKPADPFPDYDESKSDFKDYLSMVKDTATKLNSGNAVNPEVAKEHINTNLTNLLNGIEVYSPTAKTKDYAPLLDFLADTQVNKFVVGQQGFQDAQSAQKAARVLQFQYETALIPMIQNEWERFKIAGGVETGKFSKMGIPILSEEKPASESIKPQFVGSGVTFVVDPQVTDNITRLYAKELNKGVAETLNKMIRAQATLEGTNDFKGVYERNYAEQIFGAQTKETAE
ncbi:hypothetical protein D3C78_593000 [compost metagenome]